MSLIDGLQQPLAVPQRNTEPHQIIVCQVRQNVAVDRLIGEQGPVLAKPKFFKPGADVQTLHEIEYPKPRNLVHPRAPVLVSVGTRFPDLFRPKWLIMVETCSQPTTRIHADLKGFYERKTGAARQD
jgi:hypothetical protein